MTEATRTQGILLTAFVCCGWPILANLIAYAVWKWIRRRDWGNIQWSNFNLWSKDQ